MDEKMHYVVATGIIVKDGKYLIAKRADYEKAFPGLWTVPGGKLEQKDYKNRKHDTTAGQWYNIVEDLLRREVMEEVGLEIDGIKYLASLTFVRPDGIPAFVLSMFADYKAGEVKLGEGLTEHAWVTLQEAKNYELIPGIFEELEMLEKHLNGDKIGEWGKMSVEDYFQELQDKVGACYSIAQEARAQGYDPLTKVESPLAMSMAEKAVKLIATLYPQLDDDRIVKRILELEMQFGKLDPAVYFTIAEEIAHEKFCKFESSLQAIDAAIRVGFAYTTLAVVSSPIEGFTELKIGKTKENKDYFIAYFSGPIRSAGTTASCMVLMLIDYLRETFGYAKYDPDENEVKRYITENIDYHERVNNLQYLPTEEEMEFLAKNIPIQIAGDPTEQKEVSNFKDLPRVETNFIRGGMCLIFSEGLAQKAAKGFRLYNNAKKNGLKMTGWDFLEKYLEIHKKRETGKGNVVATYIKDIVAGRPVFGHPSASGAFRFRYGKSRVNGFSATSIHPSVMGITDSFLSTGTQLKLEKPTKGCVVTSCDSIDGPVVKMKDGSVRKPASFEEAKKMYNDVEEIIYLGDLLFPIGDVMNRNSELIKPGYVEEWWELELKKAGYTEKVERKINFEKALELCQKYNIPLHPRFIYFWTQIDYQLFLAFLDWVGHSMLREGKLLFPYNKTERERFSKGKRALELLGVEQEVATENVVLNEEYTKGLLFNLGIISTDLGKEVDEISKKIKEGSVLENINLLCKFKVKDKAGDFIGSRMGRPEKAKLRKLIGSPNGLFPVGQEGGRMRSVLEAYNSGSVKGDFPIYYCKKCQQETIYFLCEVCFQQTEKLNFCPECQQKFIQEKCPQHSKGQPYSTRRIDIKHFFDSAVKKIGLERSELPSMIKGVRGTSSTDHTPEHLAKGILRAKYGLCVNKDGTVRYDVTELPITHFKPKEVSVSVKKLREIGYTKDTYGNELENEEQILELMPHDIILPCCPDSKDEKADDVFINLTKFLDDLLFKFYKLKPFYNVKNREDLVGHLAVCMAPHNCAGVVARIVGFSKVQGLMASPYMHAAVRRDCVYPLTNFVYWDGEFRSEKIGEYVERLIEQGAKTEKIDRFGTQKISLEKEIYALGVNPLTKKLTKKKIKYFIKGEPPEKWVKIKTASGREQIMTPRHKFVYLDENKHFKIKKAEEIKEGDRIALLKNFKVNPSNKKSIFLPKLLAENIPEKKQRDIRIIGARSFFESLVKKIGPLKIRDLLDFNDSFKRLGDWYKVVPLDHIKKLIDKDLMKWEDLPKSSRIRTIYNEKEWGLYLKLSRDLLSILGYYSAEGYSRQTKTVSQICFRIMDKSQKNKLVSAIKNAFGLSSSLGENDTKITICNKMVYYLFEYCFRTGSGAYSKRVPDIVYNVDNNLTLAYLSAYFDGDGTIIYKDKKFICFYSVSRELLGGIALLGCKLGLFGRFCSTKERLPGKRVLERYKKLGKPPKKHVLHHLVFSGKDFYILAKILKPASNRKLNILGNIIYIEARERKIKYKNKYSLLGEIGDVFIDKVKKVDFFNKKENSYCFEIEWASEEDKNVLWGEQIINARCDGDEVAAMLLLDVLINFSRKFLPAHRGGTQDAPLVLNSKINAGEVDDQILDFEVGDYPLELYELAEQRKHSSEAKIETVKTRLKNNADTFTNLKFTHDSSDFNSGVLNSCYKSIPTMQEKVEKQMKLVGKLRAVDTGDVARLVIDRHFIRDIKGNLRKFSQQVFRCVKCNEKFRRPPLAGKCYKCGGKIIFTISQGGIIKYLEPALSLATNFNVPPYVKQNLELTKKYIESIFGRETEKQEGLGKWF